MRHILMTILIFAAFILLPFTAMVQGVETTEFIYKNNSTEDFSVELQEESDGYYKDYFSIDFPAVNVTSAAFDISPMEYNDSYARDVQINDSNHSMAEWAYSGQGYGAFGYQKQFHDSRTSRSLSFNEPDYQDQARMMLPANATVKSASVDISGRPAGSDALEDGQVASVSTNQGSQSYYPAMAIDDSGNVHVVWCDYGDLSGGSDSYYDVFYRRWDSTKWTDIQQLTGQRTTSGYAYPSIDVEGSNVYVAWNGYRIVNSSSRYTIDVVISDDGGDSWDKPINVAGESSDNTNNYDPVIATDGSEVYVVWRDYSNNEGESRYEYDVSFRASDDRGANWGNIKTISEDASTDIEHSYYPDMFVGGSTIYTVWYDNGNHDGDDTADTDIVLRSSTNNGQTWSTISLVSTSVEYAYYPQVADDGSGNVHVVWQERDTNGNGGNTILYRKSANSGSSWGSVTTVSDDDEDYLPQYPAIGVTGNDVYVAWQQYDADDTTIHQIKLRYSSNSGSSFNSGTIIDTEGYSRVRDRVHLEVDGDDNIWATWVDEQQRAWTEGTGWVGSERDIWVRQGDTGGSSWEVPLIASEYHYEANSYWPTVKVDEEGTYYMVYYDMGDLEGNGNTLHSQGDGDIFFARSTDEGQTWSDHNVVSHWEGDSNTYANSYSYSAALALGPEDTVYVAWHDYDRNHSDDTYRYKIYFRKSTDDGATWGEIQVLSTGTSTFYQPRLAAVGDNVYFTARQYDSGTYDLVFRYSIDQGDTWSDSESLTSDIIYDISLAADGDNVLVGYTYGSYSYYQLSTDGGESFESEKRVPSDDYTYEPMFTLDGSYIYIVWRGYEGNDDSYYDAVFSCSSDLGESWHEPIWISNNSGRSIYNYPSIASDEGLVYVAFNYYNEDDLRTDVFVTFSDDYGAHWEEPTPISNEDSQKYISSTYQTSITIKGQAMFAWAFYDSTSGKTHYQIMTRTTEANAYPENPDLNILTGANDNTAEWSHDGELNRDNSPQTLEGSEFVDALNDALSWAISSGNTQVDEFGVEMANISIKGTADSIGRLLLHNMEIHYDVTFTVTGERLRKSFEKDQEDAERNSKDIALSKFIVEGTTEGGAHISNLRLNTADADLELEDLKALGAREEGNDLELSVEITNKATSDINADAEVIFWIDNNDDGSYDLGEDVATESLEDLPNDGSSTLVTGTWSNIPSGDHDLYATIWHSSPEDMVDTTDNELMMSVSVTKLYAQVTIDDISFDPDPIEGEETEVSITFLNDGDKTGYVDIVVYADNTAGDDIYNASNIDVPTDGPTDEPFTWLVTSIDKFIIEWSVDSEEQDDHEEDIDILALPDFELVNISWVPTAISDNTEVNFTMIWDYKGDIAIEATVELMLTQKSQEDKTYSIIFEAGYEIAPRETLEFNQQKKLTKIRLPFDNFYAEYTLIASIYNIEPQDNKFVDSWDSNDPDFIFEDDSYTLTVTSPPDISLESISVDGELDANEDVEVEVDIINFGESAATGTLVLYTKMTGTVESKVAFQEFEIGGFGSSETVTIIYAIPDGIDGTFTFIVRVEDVLPADFIDSTEDKEIEEEDIVIHGNLKINSPEDSTSNSLIFAMIGGIIVVMAGAGVFLMRTMKGKEDDTTDDGAGAPMPGTPAAPQPTAPASPAAATGTPTAPQPTAPAGAAPAPAPPAGGATPPAAAGAAAGAASVQPVTIKCPSCQTSLKITSTQRPIVVACPSCSTKLKLEK